MAKRPGYKEAIEWLAGNDDCYWLGDYDAHGPIISVPAALVRDLWDISDEKLLKDLRAALAKMHPNHAGLRP
jgi:hypothetical protein